MPKVSVLMSVYKTNPQYLKEAVDSILGQTFADFEFLILDDCPSDTTVEETIKEYDDKRIKYLRNDRNMGISDSRNKLIDLASGEYLAVMDHDDISLPTRLTREVAFLDSHPDVGVVSTRFEQFPGKHKKNKNPRFDKDIKLALMRTCAVLHPASMIRKSVLTKNNIRYEKEFTPAEDYALWCRLIKYTKFYNIPEVLFKYRRHSTNTSKIQAAEMTDTSHRIHAFVKRENPELYQEFLNKATRTRRFCLFGGVPILTFIDRMQHHKVLLFDFIPLLHANVEHDYTIVKLFGVLPILSIKADEYKTKIMLFNLLPVVSYKNSIKLR
ncbi:MAG: glycosyltransferase [Alphaproteobacteria bacterium]|nr:glycosyltransferase [Alphaproteobacteria bacterium]